MAVPMLFGLFGIKQPEFGIGPGGGTSPKYNVTVIVPTPSTISSLIDAADAAGMTLFCNFADSRDKWCDPNTGCYGGKGLTYNPTTYLSKVSRFNLASLGTTVFNKLVDAMRRRRVMAYVVDEPFHDQFCGSVSQSDINTMAGHHKTIFGPDCLTFVRASAVYMTAPVGGWTNVDFGWAQYEGRLHTPSAGETPLQFFTREKSALKALGLRMMAGFNFLDGGSNTCWDYLNNGSSSGLIAGTFTAGGIAKGALTPCGSQSTNTRWMMSPQEVYDVANAIWNDPDVGGLMGWRRADGDTTYDVPWGNYETRGDYSAKLIEAANLLATRPTFNGWMGELTPAAPTALGYAASTPVTTRQTTTSASYGDVSGAVISSANLVAGATYMLLVAGLLDHADVNTNGSVQLVHGSTAFPATEMSIEPQSTGEHHSWFKIQKWVAVAGESLKVQIKSEGGFVTGINDVQIIALKVDDLTENTDWFYAENNTTSSAIGTTPVDGASVSITPSLPGNWLVLTSARYTGPSTTVGTISRIVRSGEASSTSPEARKEGEDATNDIMGLSLSRVFSLGAVANTFKEQSVASSGTTGQRTHSRIFALNLGKFAHVAYPYTDGHVDASGASPYADNIQTASISPISALPVLVLGSAIYASNGLGFSCKMRLQIDNSDVPAGQTSNGYAINTSADAADYTPVHILAFPTLAAGAHTADLDADASAATGRGWQCRQIVMFSMALQGVTTKQKVELQSGLGFGAARVAQLGGFLNL